MDETINRKFSGIGSCDSTFGRALIKKLGGPTPSWIAILFREELNRDYYPGGLVRAISSAVLSPPTAYPLKFRWAKFSRDPRP